LSKGVAMEGSAAQRVKDHHLERAGKEIAMLVLLPAWQMASLLYA
jgi:hypothetical protein